ncbi:MAG: hypothetical protein IT435_17910 [Phycisphaerales bacterium]|nr:hypothetical protein [Phycisphaerales bacterium]
MAGISKKLVKSAIDTQRATQAGPKGGPAGAHRDGASRGGSRIEPSHRQNAAAKDRPKK